VKSFHNLLLAFKSGSLPVSAILVAFHNLVTDSISPHFNGMRRHFYCWRDAVGKLKRSLVKDAPEYVLPELDQSASQIFDGVLGLGRHRLRDCI